MARVVRLPLWQAYLLAGALLCALYCFVPPFRLAAPVMNVLGLSPVVAIAVGLRRHRPAHRASWIAFGVGFALFWAGDIYTYSYPKLIGHEVPFPSLGDGAYLLVYPALMAGLVMLVRRRNRVTDRAGVVDSVIMTLGLGLVSWVGLIAPTVHDGSLAPIAKAVAVAYPLADVLLLAAVIRLAVDTGRRQGAFYLLVTAIIALLVTDFAYGLATLNGTYDHQASYDVGWIAFYLLWGAAALHPSMRALDEPAPDREPRLTPLRLALLTAAALVAPAIELLRELHRHDQDLVVVIAASGVLFGFVVWRMAGLIRVHEEVHRRTSEARLASLVQHASDLITVLDADGTVIYQSPSIERVLGYTAEEVVGTRFAALVHDGQARRLDMLAGGAAGETGVLECVLRHRDRTERAFEIQHTNLLDDEHVRGIVLNGRDVSERRAFELQLEHQAFHDPLTGLANRALFAERVRHAVAQARRDARGVAAIFIDLDDFKTVNDGLGHAAGDALLLEVGKRLATCIRAGDTAARFGGDEFAVLLEDVEGAARAADVAERILAALSEPLALDGQRIDVRASLGISVAEAGAPADAEELTRNADAAMCIAKRDGEGGYRLFEPAMHEGVLARLELRADLQRALAEGRLELFYQPIVRLSDGSVSGLEALLRWRHPERGLVPPDQFIPLAEENGLIVPIGRWVLREGCRQAQAIHERTPCDPPLTVAVNLSVKQLQGSDIVADVRAALDESGLDPARLTLEVTESVLMTDADLVVERLHALKALGVRLAMDDFGTGYSSLSYLSRLPVDILKMDRSFLRSGASPQASSLAAAVVGLGATLGLQVVAEGIELADQWAKLRDLGCDRGQGFHFARPMDIEATLAYLRANAPAAIR